MFQYDQVRRVHLELSEACNAACPMCDRYSYGGKSLNPIVKNKSIDLSFFKQIFTNSFIKQLDEVNFCGVLGDPLMARDLLEQVQYLVSVNPDIKILISTNGSLRSKSWWKQLGSLCHSNNKKVAFAIDGMSDTHHLYRRNTRWEKVIENAQSFIDAGGYAECQFIRFAHNEHQEPELKALVAKMGFKKFDAKDTNRFRRRSNGRYSYPVRNQGEEDPVYFLDPPSHFKPKTYSHKDLDRADINCHVWKNKEIYISAKGAIFPCCYLFSDIHRNPSQYSQILKDHDELTVSHKRSVENIVNGHFFKSVSTSWKLNSIAAGRIKKCAETCGVNLRVNHNFESLNHAR